MLNGCGTGICHPHVGFGQQRPALEAPAQAVLNQHTAAVEPNPRTSLQAHPRATTRPAAAINYFYSSKDNLYLALLKVSVPMAQTASTQSKSPRQPHQTPRLDTALLLQVSYSTMGSSKGNWADKQQLLLLLLLLFLLGEGHKASPRSLCFKMAFGAAAPEPPASSSPQGDTQHCRSPTVTWEVDVCFLPATLQPAEGWLTTALEQKLHQSSDHGHQVKAEGTKGAQMPFT